MPAGAKPVRVVAVTRQPAQGVILKLLHAQSGEVAPERIESWGFLPRAHSAFFPSLPPGDYQAVLLSEQTQRVLACEEITVGQARAPRPLASGVWPIRQSWDARMEDLFSVFVAKLFYVPAGSKKGWRPLDGATRDPYRNILYGSLGLDEDNSDAEVPAKLAPDCADAPYQVRAYFAWKMELPFLFHLCTRGGSVNGPRCPRTFSNLTSLYDDLDHPVARFNAFAKEYVSWRVHSGNPRTVPDAEATDFYPVALADTGVRPGAVFVDASGHILLVSQREAQSKSTMGAIYGVDAHPDRTVSHKRFSKGTFVFNPRVPTDGFKAFRPAVYQDGELRFMTNQEIRQHAGLPTFSAEQALITDKEKYYDTVEHLLNPRPVDPSQVLAAKIEVLHSAMEERAWAVQLGVEHMSRKSWSTMHMPKGAAIFQTEGPWESFSTPARDLRCFLAMDDALGFPMRVRRTPALYGLVPGPQTDKKVEELVQLRNQLLSAKQIRYTRSDGSKWTLTLADIVERQKALEMAYNPNDCPEVRWAAPPGSEEQRTCRRRTPPSQRRQMHLVRHWFAERRRPDQR